MSEADYRDCLELANQISESIEKADGSWVYEGDDLPGQIVPHLMPLIGELQELRRVVGTLPHTADGVPIVQGMTIFCPRGHSCDIRPSDRMSGGIYCCCEDCWSDGCQGDSGSGTHYSAEQCFAKNPSSAG